MDHDRRLVLNAGGAAALLSLAVTAQASTTGAPPVAKPPPGKAGDFNFLAGEWRIHHRQMASGPNDWKEFDGEATCWTILGGVGSVEELRIPARNFSGMGLRLLDVTNKVWNDFWVNGRSGVLTTPGQTGGFKDGIGVFTADDVDDDKPISVKGVWDQITPQSCRWWQAISRDGGKTYQENWIMNWRRA